MKVGLKINSNDLVTQTKDALHNSLTYCAINNTHVTVNKSKRSLSLIEVLDIVYLDYDFFTEIEYLLKKYKLEGLTHSSAKCTLGNFIHTCRSLSKAKAVALSLLIDVKNRDYDEDAISYIEELVFCFGYSSRILRLTNPIARTSEEYFQEYCSLCWRLVDKYRLTEFSDSENYSSHYCHEHHPSVNTNEYHKIRNKLFRAITHREIGHEVALLDDIKKSKISRDSSARHVYKLLSTFSKKPPLAKLELVLKNKKSWATFTQSFLEAIYPYYPAVEKKLSAVPINKYQNWKEWFFDSMAKIGTNADLNTWLESNDIEVLKSYEPHTNTDKSICMAVGWMAIVNIFARYQAYQNIMNLKLKKGPQKAVPDSGKKLRAEIEKLAKNQMKTNGKINAAEIARKVDRSRERVSVLLREIGLRRPRQSK